MNEKTRGALTLLGFALVALAAFQGARHWQATQTVPVRIEPLSDCDLNLRPCRRALAGGSVTFSISPAEIPLMKPLKLAVSTEGLNPEGLVVEIRGLNMDMGLNRTQLTPVGGGNWSGETILPVCSQRAMEWEAAVQLEMDRRYELPFLFHTTRP